jgi:histidinol-phosphate aminotransferase
VKFHSDLVAKGKDIVILRTFSKIYGMAGLRAGAVFARPDLMANITKWSQSGSMLPITSMAAATASLKSKTLVPERREKIGAVRDDVQAFFKKNNVKFVPSVSNCIMVDAGAGKTPNAVIAALAKEKVVVGRVWPSWPSYYRITIGTQDEMNKFKEAFAKVNA